eukprot:gene9353-9433_t
MDDAFDSELFVAAQDPIIDQVQAELRNGRKTSHWMWFIFPQLKVLGRSETARRFGLASRAQAQAYIEHPAAPRTTSSAARTTSSCAHA